MAEADDKGQETDFVVKSISGPIPCSFPVPHQAVHYVLKGHTLDPSDAYLLMEGTRLELQNCATGKVSILSGPAQITFERDGDSESTGEWRAIAE
jgi:hypothetical protein